MIEGGISDLPLIVKALARADENTRICIVVNGMSYEIDDETAREVARVLFNKLPKGSEPPWPAIA